MKTKWLIIPAALLGLLASTSMAKDLHVSTNGDDAAAGDAAHPLRTIQAAANRAMPGDVITVHEGVYRERIDPPRGGESDTNRIIYQAAAGEKVTIKGSEVIKGWKKLENDTWQVTLPNSFFGDFNPYADPIRGDWFWPQGRMHHTGAVYLNGHWLVEAASHLDEVTKPAGTQALWFAKVDGAEDADYLFNLASMTVGQQRVAADAFTAKKGELHAAPNSEGGQCIGWIRSGSWLKFDKVDFGEGTEQILFRAASATSGGEIEIRLNDPQGELLGSCVVDAAGDWKKWNDCKATIKPTRGEKAICLVFRARKSDGNQTTIWAQFPGVNPNEANVEINVRKAVFYPSQTGRNYITVRGFTLEHAATNWAPPTAEQVGLIGTHWSKGWVIENNTIRYSTCTGVTLGKHGDKYDNTSADSAEGYVETIKRGLAAGWSKENIGHHVVRNNHISDCEQAGIVGSLGAAFSTITGNQVHNIHIRQLFRGAEQAGIKIHAAIDTLIAGNHIHHCNRGIWLDWMTQGTRVTRNLLHDNPSCEDLFVEVNHGPFLVDHNLFLSPKALSDQSQGAAYAHNLFAGKITARADLGRQTPWLEEHGTKIAGLKNIQAGDSRFYNNVFLTAGLNVYDKSASPTPMAGNAFLKGAMPSLRETSPLLLPDLNPEWSLKQENEKWFLEINLSGIDKASGPPVTSELLGKTLVSGLPFVQADGSPYRLDRDFTGAAHSTPSPCPGPFAAIKQGKSSIQVWPMKE